MGVLLLLVAVDPMMIQEINIYTGVGMKNISIIQNHSHMDNLAFFVVKKRQVALPDFCHEVDGVTQLNLLLTVSGDVFSHYSA